MDELRIEGEISKVDDDERQVFGWASITEINGEPVIDLQGDLLDTYELEKAAYDYVVNSRVGGEMHDRIGKSAPKQIGTLIESMVITPEKIEKMGLPPETPHGWWIGFQVDKGEAGDQAWSKLKGGEYTGFSIHGLGKRQPVDKRVMERSAQEIEGWLKRMAEKAKVSPEQVRDDLVAWLEKDGIEDPTDEQLHNFLMAAYGGEELAKHLIGRHNQKDHDPTKGRSHSRRDHDTGRGFREGLKGFGGGVITGGALGAGLTRGDSHKAGAAAAAGGILGALGGGLHGAFRGAREGGREADERSRQRATESSPSASEPDLEGFGGGNFSLDEYQFVLQDEWNKARNELDSALKSTPKDDLEERARMLNHPAKERMREIELEMELVEDLQSAGVEKSLLALAADRSSGMDEFIENVDEIAKAFGDHELGEHFATVHKHLVGRHRQKDHDPTKGKGHSREEHGDTKGAARRGAGYGGALGAIHGLGSTLGMRMPAGARGLATLGTGAIGAGIGAAVGGEWQALGGGRSAEKKRPAKVDAWMEQYGASLEEQANSGNRYRPSQEELDNMTYNVQPRGKDLNKRQIEILEKYLGEEAR